MAVSSLMIVDPVLSGIGVLRRILSSNIKVVLYCEDTEAVPCSDLLEVRGFGSEDLSTEGVDCILEFIDPAKGEEKIRLLSSPNVCNSDIPLFACGMSMPLRDDIRAKVPKSVLDRLVSVHFPSFYQRDMVFECLLHAENSESYKGVLQGLNGGTLKFIFYSDFENLLYDRVGCFLAAVCLAGTHKCKLGIEVADYLLANENTGIPSPGIFKMLDQWGIDCFVEMLASMAVREGDEFLTSVYRRLPDVVHDMVYDELVGVRSRGGFYRTYDMRYGKVDQVVDIVDGLYRAEKKDMYLQECLLDAERCNKFADFVWGSFFSYIKYIESSGIGTLPLVDSVLCIGYGWKYGVRELAVRTGKDFSSIDTTPWV